MISAIGRSEEQNQAQGPPLDDFPEELLRKIFSSLGGKSLIAVEGTCRRWRVIVKDSPQLQSNIEFSKFIYGCPGVLLSYDPSNQPPCEYVRAIALEPDIRQSFIQSLPQLPRPDGDEVSSVSPMLEIFYELRHMDQAREFIDRIKEYAPLLNYHNNKLESYSDSRERFCQTFLRWCAAAGYSSVKINEEIAVFDKVLQTQLYTACTRIWEEFSVLGEMLPLFLSRMDKDLEPIFVPSSDEFPVPADFEIQERSKLDKALVQWYAKNGAFEEAFEALSRIDEFDDEDGDAHQALHTFAKALVVHGSFDKAREVIKLDQSTGYRRPVETQLLYIDVIDGKILLKNAKARLFNLEIEEQIQILTTFMKQDRQKQDAIILLKELAYLQKEVALVDQDEEDLRELAFWMHALGEVELADWLAKRAIESCVQNPENIGNITYYLSKIAEALLPHFPERAEEAHKIAMGAAPYATTRSDAVIGRAKFLIKKRDFPGAANAIASLDIDYERLLVYGELFVSYRKFLDQKVFSKK